MRRTAKGDMVDFDLIRAKSQMASKPAPTEVSVRQQIIDRRLRKKTTAMNPSPLNTTQVPRPAPPPHKEPPVPKVPEPVDVEDEELIVDDSDDTSTQEESAKPRRRQKTKPKQSSGDEDVTD